MLSVIWPVFDLYYKKYLYTTYVLLLFFYFADSLFVCGDCTFSVFFFYADRYTAQDFVLKTIINARSKKLIRPTYTAKTIFLIVFRRLSLRASSFQFIIYLNSELIIK